MKRVLFDTSAYSLLRRKSPEAAQVLRESRLVVISPIVLGELRAGFWLGSRRTENEAELQQFLASWRVKVAAVTGETSGRYAIIENTMRRQGTPLPANDVWIAATAMEFGMTLVTADRHFQWVPQITVTMLPVQR